VADCSIVNAHGERVVAGEFSILVGPSSRGETLLSDAFQVTD
jgi:beta-glucosidase